MAFYTTLLLGIYICFLIGLVIYGKIKKTNSINYLFMGGKVGFFLSFMGLMASFFSVFTLKGMPEFINKHGVGGWLVISLPVTLQVSLMLPFGLWIRKKVQTIAKANKTEIYNIEHLLHTLNLPKVVQIFFLVFVSLFILPYITIQIKGVATLMNAILPFDPFYLLGISRGDFWGGFLFWSFLISIAIFFYSFTGGIKSIYITDALQGFILFVTVWLMAILAIKNSGGIAPLFQEISTKNPEFLNLPGANHFLTLSFIFSYLISLLVAQISQPHLFMRILIIKDQRTFIKTFMSLAIISPLIFLPNIIVGLYGRTFYTGNFWVDLLQTTIPPLLGAIYLIGLLAASMSTVDSQIFAIGTEWAGLFKKKLAGQKQIFFTKFFSFLLIATALVIAQFPLQSLVVFAAKSFMGTGLLSPILLGALLFYDQRKIILRITTIVASFSFYFLLSILKIVPEEIANIHCTLYFHAVYILLFSFLLWGKKIVTKFKYHNIVDSLFFLSFFGSVKLYLLY